MEFHTCNAARRLYNVISKLENEESTGEYESEDENEEKSDIDSPQMSFQMIQSHRTYAFKSGKEPENTEKKKQNEIRELIKVIKILDTVFYNLPGRYECDI